MQVLGNNMMGQGYTAGIQQCISVAEKMRKLGKRRIRILFRTPVFRLAVLLQICIKNNFLFFFLR